MELPLIFVNNHKYPETNENKLQHARHEKGRLQAGPISTKHLTCSGLTLAGELGFEPRLTESESAVLPLNYSPPRSQIAVDVGFFNMDKTDK
jgi:hypothetical protein